MKRNLTVLIIAAFLTMAPAGLFAQPHPNGGYVPNAPGGPTNHPVGPSAPVGSGTLILMVLAAAYTGRKVYVMRASSESL